MHLLRLCVRRLPLLVVSAASGAPRRKPTRTAPFSLLSTLGAS